MVSVHPMCFEHMCECLGSALHVRQANIYFRPGPCWCSALLLLGSRDLEHPRFVPIGLHGVMASWTWAISFLRESGWVTMNSARLTRLCTTDYLCWRWWLELKFKYWSVWVVLRYTVTCVLPSRRLEEEEEEEDEFRKGKVPSCSGSVVKLMLESRLLRSKVWCWSPGCWGAKFDVGVQAVEEQSLMLESRLLRSKVWCWSPGCWGAKFDVGVQAVEEQSLMLESRLLRSKVWCWSPGCWGAKFDVGVQAVGEQSLWNECNVSTPF